MKKKRVLALLLTACMVVPSTAVPAVTANAADPDGLTDQVLDLKFEDNLTDSSTKGNNGTISSGQAEYVDGVVGKALKLSGDKYVDLGKSTDLQPENLTLSFWLKPNADMGGGEQVITWSKNEWYTDGWYVSSENADTPLCISIGPELDGSRQPYKVSVAGMSRSDFFKTGEWTHVVITYNKETKEVKFYRNGTECQTNVNYAIGGNRTGVLGSDAAMQKSIGWNGPVHRATSLNAALDEYQLFNDVATLEEVISLYEEGGKTIDKQAIAQADANALYVPAETKGNLILANKGASGSVVTWSSSNKEVITDNGKVTRPEIGQPDVDVTMTAKVSYAGGATVTKEFVVKVLAKVETTIGAESVMGDVSLQDPWLVNASQKEVDYLLSMNSKKFLYEFYKVAGLTPPTDSGYGGWERTGAANFRGHTFGHYMSALSQAYLTNPDEETKEKLMTQIRDAVAGLEECQNAYAVKYPEHAGYISAFPEGVCARVDGVASPTPDDGTVLVPYYNLHKVLAGLLDISKNVDDADLQERALAVAEGFGEFLYNRLSKLTDKNKMLSIEYGGMNEALYELYNLTGNDHYKTAAEYFDETNLFTQLANHQDVLNGKHANTTIPKLTGAVKRYTVLTENEEYYNALTQEEKEGLDLYLTAAENFWDIVIKDHTYITGGNSQSEHFHAAGKIGEDATKGSYDNALTCETCNTYNMLKLSKALFRVTKDKKYMDYFENTYTNAILPSQNPETGTTMYFQPMAPGYNKVFNRPHDEFWCCTGTGMENFSKLGDNIYQVEGKNVYVHMFYSSTITSAENNLVLKQTANMPNEDTVVFEVAAADGKNVKEGTTIRLRKPDWLAAEAEIKVNDKAVALKEASGYYLLENVKAGDRISYKMPMKVQLYDMPDKPNMIAFKYGPVVLSTALGTADIERSAANGILVRVGTKDPNAKTTIYIANYTDIEEWKKDVEKNLVRIEDSEDGQVQFKLQNTDSPELTFTPHYMRYKESYGLYMFLEAADSESAQQHILEEKEKLRETEMSTDYVYTFDGNNYENEKNIQASANSSVGVFSDKAFRHAEGGGWFSYDLKIDPEAEQNYVYCMFYSGDRSRRFDIKIDGQSMEDGAYEFEDAPQDNTFYEHKISVPQEIVEAAEDGKITIRFESVNNSLVGGLYGLRTATSDAYSTDAAMKGLSFDVGTLTPAFDPETTEYVLEVPEGTESVAMKAVPNMPSGLIYVGNILINDNVDRIVKLSPYGTTLNITATAQDHKTNREYKVTIKREGEEDLEKPELLADFNFDTDGEFFDGGYAKATGNYDLADHGTGKALKLNGTDQFLTVTDKEGASLLTGVEEMTISYQINPSSSRTNWGFFAAPNANTQEYEKEHYIGIVDIEGTTKAERYNGGPRPVTAEYGTGYNGWYHVTVVHTKDATKLYVNGEKVAEEASTFTLPQILGDNSILYIGKSTWVDGEYATATIDNYKIYRKALTDEEIAAEAAKYVDKAALKAAIHTKVDAEDTYTPATWKAYADALKAANDIYKKENATQSEVNKAEADLKSAISKLAKVADKESLEAAIGDAVPDTDKDKYTVESWEAYQTALAKAKEVAADKNATKKEVEDALKALEKAQGALEPATAEPVTLPFVDVTEDDWFYDGVYYNYVNKIVEGKDKTHYAPYENLARAQFAVILHRIAGKPAAKGNASFPDVQSGQWYTDAVLWAADKEVGIIRGYSDSGLFGTADNITREQMAVMMYRYAEYKGYDLKADGSFDKFADGGKVTEFAQTAMKWAIGTGIISGKDLNGDGTPETLDPQGNTSRAECAIIIQRFMETYEK